MAITQNTNRPHLEHVGRVVSYELHHRGESGPRQVTFGCVAIDSTYEKGAPRGAAELLAYINKTAFDEAAKDPGFIENWGENPADFFVTIQHEFRT